ncbi:hypothetical protein HUO13_01230 [Saccharopolyspora erythraea]|uniref:hypothetical protein n=1 Tax=Saccharopolyspora erythraea TaxID=1836 RepID=UPI001BA4B43F|nr:hypothetical protein [Saccharopolyspora erythraea]QUG99599.1 hypothetical protein HUO13_01230 [Saccharopolyspora erythraea]
MDYVRPYRRKDGTYVRSHYRRSRASRGPSTSTTELGAAAGILVTILFLFWIFGGSEPSASTTTTAPTWEAAGYTATEINTSTDTNCAGHSYGQVHQFFGEQPCIGLQRKLFKAEDDQGNAVLIATARADMASPSAAKALNGLAERNGSGNVTPLAHETAGYQHISFTGKHYASHPRESAVHIAETEPLTGNPSAATMRELAKQALEHL